MRRLVRKTRVAWNHPRHAHFLTYSCYRRYPLLQRNRSRTWIIDALERMRLTHDVALWAYVIMPEHVHVLFYPRADHYEMRTILVALKRPVSDAARSYLHETKNREWINRLSVKYPTREVFRFWQPGGGFDKNIFKETSIPAIMDYIENNPVRRGLVSTPTDWPWSSARFRQGLPDALIRMDDPAP